MGYFEAYAERLQRNQSELFKLADEVLSVDPTIEIYHSKRENHRLVSSLVFFKDETINSIGFHEVPYRWSGCGYGEFNGCHSGGENVCMPFDVNDVLTTFKPIAGMRKSQTETFKDKEHYLKWCSYLEPYQPLHQLTHKGDVLLTGTENECYIKLQRTQSQSADWAMKYEGYKIEPVKL